MDSIQDKENVDSLLYRTKLWAPPIVRKCENNNYIFATETNQKPYESLLKNDHGCKFEEQKSKSKPNKGNSVDPLIKQVKDLQLVDESLVVAGTIESIIPSIQTVVVKPSDESVILSIGTAIFIEKESKVNYEIGNISDIFGSIKEPMYSIELKEDVDLNNGFTVGSQVFYVQNHASTGFVYVQRMDESNYVVKSK